MTRSQTFLIVLVVWAAIYLPGLGTLEIKGEEGRRILPAVMMLQTGNFIVPYVGSDPYFTKPPLINWLVAGFFALTGQHNEWSARLPSVLAVLAVALAFVTIARGALGPNGSFIAALVWMTNFGIVEKGRLIEIEALYVSLTGLAFIGWLSWWQERRSPWLTWVVPWIFLGLALLTKGPLNLVFFYAVVVAILYRAGELRQLWNAAHLFGFLLMLGIFGAWAIPCLQMMPAAEVADNWARQFSGRVSGEDFKFSGWIRNIPRGLGYFLPWTLLLLAAQWRTSTRVAASGVRRSLLFGLAASFIVVSLLPGSLPRYTMPLLVPAAWLMALLLGDGPMAFPRWLRLRWPAAVAFELRWPVLLAAVAVGGILIHTVGIMPTLRSREKVRTIAEELNAALPAGEPLFVVDPDYQPALFYVRSPILYYPELGRIPPQARYLLVQARDEAETRRSGQWLPRKAEPLLRLRDYRNKEIALFEIREPTP